MFLIVLGDQFILIVTIIFLIPLIRTLPNSRQQWYWLSFAFVATVVAVADEVLGVVSMVYLLLLLLL